MNNEPQCRAITRAGTRCTRAAKTAGFCTIHFPKTSKPTLLEQTKTVGQIVTTATGVITLIKGVVDLWQSLPFGTGPTMPDAWEQLRNELGSAWGSPSSNTYTPGNYGVDSIDWSQALDIYQFAKSQLESESKSSEHQEQTAAILSTLTEQFIDSLPYNIKQNLYEKIGEAD